MAMLTTAEFFVEAVCVFNNHNDQQDTSAIISENYFRPAPNMAEAYDDQGIADAPLATSFNKNYIDYSTEPAAYNNIDNDISVMDAAPSDYFKNSEYANCLEVVCPTNRAHDLSVTVSSNEDEFFQNTGTSLEATVDLFNELFPHLANKLSLLGNSDTLWTDRLISYWNELGIDQATINVTLLNLGINSNSVEDSENAVRLLFQRFAEALTGICVSHPCSTAIFLTAFDELKATRQDAADASDQLRQVESELGECKRRIALLADEADERCRAVEASVAEKLLASQKSNSLVISEMRNELDAERNAWMNDREQLLAENRRQAESVARLQKRYEDEVQDSSYWKDQANKLRKEYDAIEKERNQLLQRVSVLTNRYRQARKSSFQYCDNSSCEDSADSSGETTDETSSSTATTADMRPCKLSVELKEKLDEQVRVNDAMSGEIELLKEKLAKCETELAAKMTEEPKVTREDSGLGMTNATNNSVPTCSEEQTCDDHQSSDKSSWTNDYEQPPIFNNHCNSQHHNPGYESLDIATRSLTLSSPDEIAMKPEMIDAAVQANSVLPRKSRSCQVTLSEATEEHCEQLQKSVCTLETSLAESVAAFNGLRSRYHKQLVRTNQLIDLTNKLYAENCRLVAESSKSNAGTLQRNRQRQAQPATSRSSSAMDGYSPNDEPRPKSKSKRRSSKKEEIYVVVGPHAGIMLG